MFSPEIYIPFFGEQQFHVSKPEALPSNACSGMGLQHYRRRIKNLTHWLYCYGSFSDISILMISDIIYISTFYIILSANMFQRIPTFS